MERGLSWAVAACCCFCNMTFYGVSRLSGILLVPATHAFQVPRATAAMPFSISSAIRNLTGVVVGHLGHRFGVGPVVTVGCLIASLGSGLCFFAQDMQWINVCWGGIFGFGFGLSTCLLPFTINQHFTGHIGTASGISYSGAYIGSFIFPPLVKWLLGNYGYQGTLLILSGGILHVLLAAMFLGKNSRRNNRSRAPTEGNEQNGEKKNELCGTRFSVVSCNGEKQQRSELENNNNNQRFPMEMEKSWASPQRRGLDRRSSSLVSRASSKKSGKSCSSNALEGKGKGYSIFYVPTEHTQLNGTYSGLESHSVNGLDKRRVILPLAQPLAASDLTEQKNKVFLNEYRRNSSILPIYKSFDSFQVSNDKKYRSHSNKRLSLDNVFASKRKVKLKFKLKKLRKVLVTSLAHLSNGKPELFSSNGVQLLSFKYYSSFRGSPKACENRGSKLNCGSLTADRSGLGKKYFPINEDGDTNNSAPSNQMENTHNKESQSTDSSSSVQKDDYFAHAAKECSSNSSSQMKLGLKANEYCSSFENYSPTSNRFSEIVTAEKMHMDDSRSSSIAQHTICVRNCSLPLTPAQLTGDCLMKNQSLDAPEAPISKKLLPGWVRTLCEPMFIIISCTMSIQTLIVVCVVTTIEDYATDIGIVESKGYYSMMTMSLANLIGTLTLGFVTDRKFISRHRFLSLCFLGMSVSLASLTMVAKSLPSLLSVLVVYGLLESGVIITFPVTIKEFVKGEKRQAVAIASSNALSAPTVMLVPMLIGHYRDKIGCYSGLYHLLAGTSLACSLIWLVAPSLCKRRNFAEKLKPLLNIVKSKK